MRLVVLGCVFLLLTVLCTSAFVEDWMYKAEDASFEIETGTSVETKGVISITANLTLYPRTNHRQQVISTESFPQANGTIFYWPFKTPEEISFSTVSQISTNSDRIRVTKKIPFPLKEQHDFYVTSTDNIDVDDPHIQDLASQLAENTDDLYELVFKVGSWVEQNINYSLDTITIEASQPASWVLENRRGVCDEMTNLFIAIMRALDVPARFVSGYAYTSLEYFDEPWGPHGWAEVYFPDYGWIPVDLAYKQIGWIDLSHIQLKEAVDALVPSVVYTWQGGEIIPDPLSTVVKIISVGKNRSESIFVSSRTKEQRVGFGSYNLLEVSLHNPHDYYFPTVVNIGPSDSIQLIDKSYRLVLLKPNERRTETWLIRVKDDLDVAYSYELFFVTVADNVISKTSFFSSPDYNIFPQNNFKRLPIEKTYFFSDAISLTCSTDEEIFYKTQTIDVSCKIKSDTVQDLPMSLCFQGCKPYIIKANTTDQQDLTYTPTNIGRQDLKIKLQDKGFIKTAVIPVTILPEPKIRVDKKYPLEVEYRQVIPFQIMLDSHIDPLHNVSIVMKINRHHIEKDHLDQLVRKKYLIGVPARLLNKGVNNVTLLFTFTDRNGNLHEQTDSFNISLVNVKWWQQSVIWLRNQWTKVFPL